MIASLCGTHPNQLVLQGTLAELERVQERGMGVVAATVYNSGMLIHGGKVDNPVCNYRSVSYSSRRCLRAQLHNTDLV